MSLMIKQTDTDGDETFLNHAYLSTLSFGSPDMAWMTEDREKAYLMLFKIEASNRESNSSFEVVEW